MSGSPISKPHVRWCVQWGQFIHPIEQPYRPVKDLVVFLFHPNAYFGVFSHQSDEHAQPRPEHDVDRLHEPRHRGKGELLVERHHGHRICVVRHVAHRVEFGSGEVGRLLDGDVFREFVEQEGQPGLVHW